MSIKTDSFYANKLIAQQENINASIDIRTSNGLTFPAFSLNNLHTLYLKPDINTNGYDSRLRLFKNIGGTALGYTLLVPTLEPNDNKNTSAQIELPNTTQRLIGTAGSNILEGNFSPKVSNTYNLGAPSHQWQNIYATTFNGNLVGNAETATSLQNLTASITELNYMSGVTDNIQEQLNSLLPLAGGVVTGITTFGDNIIKTTNGGQPGGQWTNTDSRSQLIIGSKGASEGEITLYHANGNSVTLKTEAYQSIAAIDLTLPSHYSQTLIGTAGSSELAGHLTPALNAEINLGSTFSPWNTIYAKNIIFGNSNHIYGTEDQRLALSPSLGQIFFQLIDE